MREPDWARVPPHAPTYPNPPAYFRNTAAETFTAPCGKAAYSTWWSKWHHQHPEWHTEHYRTNSMTPVMRKIEFEAGTLKPAYTASWDHPDWRQQYLRQGVPESEAVRARAFNRTHWATKDKNLYQFSNAMTSTQYKKPVTSVWGPMLRESVYGLNTQHSRHGFMGFDDYYF